MKIEGKQNGARFFSVFSAGDGSAALRAALGIASWLSARGLRALVVSGSDCKAFAGARNLREVAPHLDRLDPGILRGMLAQNGSMSPGFILCDATPESDFFSFIERAYSIVIFAAGEGGISLFPGVLALVVVCLSDESGISSAGLLIDGMLVKEGGVRPVGFALDSSDAVIGERLSSKWHLPHCGSIDDAGCLAKIALKRATPLRLNTEEIDVRPIGAGASTPGEEGEGEAGNVFQPSREEEAARHILSLLREEREFREMGRVRDDGERSSELKLKVAAAARRLIGATDCEKLREIDTEKVVARIVDDAAGLGPLEPFLSDPAITEIMVNGESRIYLERDGVIEASNRRFFDRGQLMAVIERMVARAGRRIDELSPMVDARLSDGSRLNVVIPPLAVDGPVVTIRRFLKRMRSMDDAVRSGMLTREAADFLCACVKARISMIVSGGTGAGKTTLLGILAGAIERRERIITIEDAAELRLDAKHVVRLEARPPGIEGTGGVSIRDLVRNALRMRPDRIIVGETRGPEALDMLQAMNTGHEGSLATVHANSPRDAVSRLETMVLTAGMELPLHAVREQIARAVGLIVQVARVGNGARRVIEIAELSGMEGTTACFQTIAALSEEGKLKFTGILPRFHERVGGSDKTWNA